MRSFAPALTSSLISLPASKQSPSPPLPIHSFSFVGFFRDSPFIRPPSKWWVIPSRL